MSLNRTDFFQLSNEKEMCCGRAMSKKERNECIITTDISEIWELYNDYHMLSVTLRWTLDFVNLSYFYLILYR